jgi:hypothetical protein
MEIDYITGHDTKHSVLMTIDQNEISFIQELRNELRNEDFLCDFLTQLLITVGEE